MTLTSHYVIVIGSGLLKRYLKECNESGIVIIPIRPKATVRECSRPILDSRHRYAPSQRPSQMLRDLGEQGIDVKGLGQEIVGPGPPCRFFCIRMGGEHNDRDMAGLRLTLEEFHNITPVPA